MENLAFDLVLHWQVLAGIDHINSCKPHSKSDPAYRKTLEFLQNIIDQTPDAKLKSRH